MIVVDAVAVRDVLGPFGSGWTDAQIENDAVMIPARNVLLELCPAADSIVDAADMASAQVALASIVASNLIMSSPRFQSSTMGDSQVTFAANSEVQRANRLMDQAKDLMAGVCPAPPRPALVTLYRQAPGGRGL